MTIEKETLQRVHDGLYHLVRGLTPFVEARMKARHGANWLHYISGATLDASGLLKTMLDNWRGVFDEAFERYEKHEVRNFTSTAFKARNAASHPIPPIKDDEALHYLYAMNQLLSAVKASEAEVAELKHLYDEQRRSGLSTPGRSRPEVPSACPVLQGPSNTERGKAFQILCGDALKRAVSRDFDLEVPIAIGGGKSHSFDLATRERDIVAECKAFTFTATGNNPSAKITTLREAAMYLRSIEGNVARLLIVKHAPHPKRGETLGRYFVRLNINHLQQVTVLEMPESGGDLVCIHGDFGAEP